MSVNQETARRQVKQWQAAGLLKIRVAVNLDVVAEGVETPPKIKALLKAKKGRGIPALFSVLLKCYTVAAFCPLIIK